MNVLDFSILTVFITLISAFGILLGNRRDNIGLAQSYSSHCELFVGSSLLTKHCRLTAVLVLVRGVLELNRFLALVCGTGTSCKLWGREGHFLG